MDNQGSPAPISAGISFELTPRQSALQAAMRNLVEESAIPREACLRERGGVAWALVQELRGAARAAGVYGPTIHAEYGGLEADWRTVAVLFEEAGTSLLGPLAINSAAPDEGNMHLLQQVAGPEQKARFLEPLARGEVRSCFAMTEPAPGAGADPNMLRTRARRDGGEWVLDGHKWYITGAHGAAFAIIMARTSETSRERSGATMFLAPMAAPGLEIVRQIGSLDHTFLGGHCELRFDHLRLPDSAVLGEVDRGFEYAQVRLAPARLTHCMRWLGIARRSLEIAAAYANERQGFGKPLGEHQMVQAMLADSAIDVRASRLLIWQAAWALDQGRPAREETQMAKVFVAEAVNRVVDRALQICGARGVSDDLPLNLFYREIRPFRIYDGPSEVHRAAIARRVLRAAHGKPSA
jgi:acyl-CoA dehydrogenase